MFIGKCLTKPDFMRPYKWPIIDIVKQSCSMSYL